MYNCRILSARARRKRLAGSARIAPALAAASLLATPLFAHAAAPAAPAMVGAPVVEEPGVAVVLVEVKPAVGAAVGGALAPAGATLLGAAGWHTSVVRVAWPPATGAAAGRARELLHAGLAAYDALRFADAVASFTAAEGEAVSSGAAGLAAAELADVFLFRGMARFQLKSPGDWDDFVQAALYAPGRTLDPGRFPPAARDTYARAVAEVAAKPRGAVAVGGPAGGRAFVDGAEAGTLPARVEGLPWGAHLVRVESKGHLPWTTRVVLASAEVSVNARPAAAPPDLRSADASALAAYGAEEGAALVVGLHADATGGGTGTGTGTEPATVTVHVRAVRVTDGRELLATTVRGPADRPDEIAAGVGLALRALLPSPPPLSGTVGPPGPAPRRAPAWLRWLPAVLGAGAALVAGGIIAAVLVAPGRGFPGFGVHATLPEVPGP
jgi:hypothetical protein